MSIADSAVQEFGAAMGMSRLAFNEHGVVRLNFQRAGTLSIERTAHGAVLQLARPVDRFRDDILEHALELCHHDKADRLRADAGVAKDGSLVFSVTLDEAAMDLATLEDVFQFLRRLHDRVGS